MSITTLSHFCVNCTNMGSTFTTVSLNPNFVTRILAAFSFAILIILRSAPFARGSALAIVIGLRKTRERRRDCSILLPACYGGANSVRSRWRPCRGHRGQCTFLKSAEFAASRGEFLTANSATDTRVAKRILTPTRNRDALNVRRLRRGRAGTPRKRLFDPIRWGAGRTSTVLVTFSTKRIQLIRFHPNKKRKKGSPRAGSLRHESEFLAGGLVVVAVAGRFWRSASRVIKPRF